MGGLGNRTPLSKNMKNKKVFIGLASLLLVLGVTACNKKEGGEQPGGDDKEESLMIDATINRQILNEDDLSDAQITCALEGVSYHSSNEKVVEVNSRGYIEVVDKGDAFVTVSKDGHFDKVFKVFVDRDNTIDYLVEGFEFGPAIVGIKISLPGKVTKTALEGATFTARTNNSNRQINKVSLCDIEGQYVTDSESKYVRLDLQTNYSGWGVQNGAGCFTYANSVNNWTQNITADVTFTSALQVGSETIASGTKIDRIRTRTTLSTRDWGEAKSFTAYDYTLTYKAYEVEALRLDGVKNPLVVWLHGMGEGGTDPDIALLGNDVTALGEEEIQSHFVKGQQKGAYVLAVQTPTYWMNSGTGSINGGVGHSIYTQTLKATIDDFIEHNLDIDTNRIYVGGCSNGGYMTMEMAVTYGSFFRAFYPCCEAYSDSFVTDEDIQKLKDLPMWFIHAANDTTVNANNFVIPTYQRLMRAGAKDIHFSYFVDVRGTDGNPSGNSYQGHYSWIYIFRDEVEFDQADPENIKAPSDQPVKDANGNTVNLFDWMESMK